MEKLVSGIPISAILSAKADFWESAAAVTLAAN